MHATYRVIAPMPEIGAEPGDYLYAEPADPDFPLTLTRHFDRNVLPIVLDNQRLKLVSVSDPSSQPQLELAFSAPAPQPSPQPAPRRWSASHLRLVG